VPAIRRRDSSHAPAARAATRESPTPRVASPATRAATAPIQKVSGGWIAATKEPVPQFQSGCQVGQTTPSRQPRRVSSAYTAW